MALIDAIRYGEITIAGKTYYGDLVLSWDGQPRMLEKTHLLAPALLRKLLRPGADSLVVGTGLRGTVKTPSTLREQLEKKSISLFIDRTMNAMEIYNAFVRTGKRPVGVMHVTL